MVGLVSAYRYEGPKVNEELAKSEAKALGNAIKSAGTKGDLLVNDEVIRILTTRSKLHLRATFKHYKEIFGKSIEEVSDSISTLEYISKMSVFNSFVIHSPCDVRIIIDRIRI